MISGIAIVQTTFAGSVHHGVFCTKTVIARGSRFGPFKGRVIHTSEIKTNDDNSCMWEVGRSRILFPTHEREEFSGKEMSITMENYDEEVSTNFTSRNQ